MKDKTNPVARVFAILISILLVLSGVVSILVFNLVRQAFDPNLYKQAVTDSGLYQEIPILIGEQINKQAGQVQDSTSPISMLPAMTPEQWSAILTPLIDPAWVQKQVESVIDQVFRFINEPGSPLRIEISLTELKTRLSGEEGYQAVMQVIHNLPPCTNQDLLSLPASLLSGGTLPTCQPSEAILQQAEGPIHNILTEMADAIPDNTGPLFSGMANELGSNMADSLQRLQLVRTIALLTPIVPLFLLLLITLLVVRSLKGFLRWWGIPMIVTGVLSLAGALMISPLFKVLVISKVNLPGVSSSLVSLIQDLLMNIAHTVEETLVLQAVVLAGAGILMVILAAVIKPKSSESLPG